MKRTKLNMTPKQFAAAILVFDMEKITGYWSEAWHKPSDSWCHITTDDKTIEEINTAMAKILEPFMERLYKIVPDDKGRVKYPEMK